MERARDWLAVQRPFAVGVEIGRERRPARGAQQRVEICRGHGLAGGGIRQRGRFKQVAFGFKLPQQAFCGWRVIVRVLQVDEVQTPRVTVEGLDGRNHATPVTDGGQHAGAGDGVRGYGGGHDSLPVRRRSRPNPASAGCAR